MVQSLGFVAMGPADLASMFDLARSRAAHQAEAARGVEREVREVIRALPRFDAHSGEVEVARFDSDSVL